MDINSIKRIYFIGIGGIGMSALARYFRSRGVKVSGYDRTATSLTRQLESEGISVHYEDDPDQADKDAELVVYTPAVPKQHKEWLYFQQHGYTILKRSDVLGAITNSSFNICVAGTHGKDDGHDDDSAYPARQRLWMQCLFGRDRGELQQ